MTVFIDTNVVVYASVAHDRGLAERCQAVLAAAARPGSGFVTSTLVIEELLHLELSGRLPGIEGAAVDACDLLSPLLPITEDVVRSALSIGLPATIGSADRMHIATCRTHGIETLVSADRAFDAVDGLRRVDPLDAAAVARLLS